MHTKPQIHNERKGFAATAVIREVREIDSV